MAAPLPISRPGFVLSAAPRRGHGQQMKLLSHDRAGSTQRACPALSLHQNSWGNEAEAQVPGCAPEHQFSQPYLDVNGVFRTILVFTHRQ